MDSQNPNKRPGLEMKGHSLSKQPHLEMNEDESSTESLFINSPASDMVNYDNTSNSSSTSGRDSKAKMKISVEPWNVPIHSETKKLCFMPVDPSGKNHIQKLDVYSQQETLHRLKRIDINFTYCIEDTNLEQSQQIAGILNRILLASADSLEEIILSNPIGYLPGLVFPIMNNVTKLQLLFYWNGSETTNFSSYLKSGEIFPKGFQFTVLSRLEEVIIILETEVQGQQYYTHFDCWENNLHSCGIAKGVKTIEYSDDFKFSTRRLKITFPNANWDSASSCED